MSPFTRVVRRSALALLVTLPATLPAQQAEKIDLAALGMIRDEGFNRSKVMEIASYLTDVHGSRLTGSPQAKAAGDWTLATLRSWGVSNARYETWGPFGRGWSNERFSARVTSPTAYPLIAYPAAWSYGTNGPVAGQVTVVRIDTVTDIAKYRGTLKGKWVMSAPAVVVPAKFEALGRRWTDAQLDSMAALPAIAQQGGAMGGRNADRFRAMQELNRQRTEFFASEGIAGILQPGAGRNDYGAVLGSGGGSRAADARPTPPVILVSTEQYGRMARTIEKGIPVTVEIDADNRFHEATLNSFNIIAEIPGTDRALRDEVVMLGAHFDSWHTGTGATDNASGSSVMLEALRILKATGVPMKRTVRLALWTGEEQGLLGSRAYVRETFGYRDSTGMHTKPAYEKFSAYYNMDNGTGAFRGIYAQGNAAVRPIFEQWMAPLRDLGMRVTTIRNTGSTDHVAFDAVGLPGFQFIQDPIEYGTRTHHSNQDLYDRLQPEDLQKNAVIAAWFVYQTANRDERLPRKEASLTP